MPVASLLPTVNYLRLTWLWGYAFFLLIFLSLKMNAKSMSITKSSIDEWRWFTGVLCGEDVLIGMYRDPKADPVRFLATASSA